MSEETVLPKHLYKYRSWSNPLHRRIITDREIWFASPRSFNDPFDCRVPMRYDKLSRDQFYQTQIQIFTNQYPNVEPELIEQLAEDSTKELFAFSQNEYDEFVLQQQRVHDAEMGIFTTSSLSSDILMWSHYSDSHKGFCVEFNTKALVEFINEERGKFKSPIIPYEVNYPEDDIFPTLIPLPGLSITDWMEQYLVKSYSWKYEFEYRLIGFGATDLIIQLSTDIITNVILGCEMPDTDQDEIIHELLKLGGGIALERAVKSKDQFGLEFEPVEY